MDRITTINSKLTSKRGSFVDDSIKFLNFDESFFTPELNEYRLKLRKELENNMQPYITEVIEKAECADKFAFILEKLNSGRCYVKKPYGDGVDSRKFIATILEAGRLDASFATFYLVQIVLFANTIGK